MGLSRFLLKRVLSALFEIGGATRFYPHERFRDLGRYDADSRAPWVGRDVEMCREALYAAHTEGPDVQAEVVRRIDRYLGEKRAAIMTGFVELQESSLPAMAMRFTKESTEAICAVQEARESGSESAILKARHEVEDVYGQAPRLLEMLDYRPSMQVRR